MRNTFLIVLFLITVAGGLTATAFGTGLGPLTQQVQRIVGADNPTYPEVVAIVNGVPISHQALARQVALLKEVYHQSETEVTPQNLERQALENLIRYQLLAQYAKEHGLWVSFEEAQAFAQQVEDLMKAFPPGSDERLAMEAVWQIQGLNPQSPAADPRVIEGYQLGLSIGRARAYIIQSLPPEVRTNPQALEQAIDDFVANLRRQADVKIFIRLD